MVAELYTNFRFHSVRRGISEDFSFLTLTFSICQRRETKIPTGSGRYHQQLTIAVCNFYTQCILYWVRGMCHNWAGLWSVQSITLTSSPYFRERGKRNLVPSLLCDIYSACTEHPTRGSLLCNDQPKPQDRAVVLPCKGMEKVTAFCSGGGRDSEMGKQELTFTPSDFLFSRLLAAVKRSRRSRSVFDFYTLLTSLKTAWDFRMIVILVTSL